MLAGGGGGGDGDGGGVLMRSVTSTKKTANAMPSGGTVTLTPTLLDEVLPMYVSRYPGCASATVQWRANMSRRLTGTVNSANIVAL